MAHAKEVPHVAQPSNYDVDFYAWTYEQAELLRHGRFGEADLPNIIEELETLGRSERNAMIASYRLIVQHLLKWTHQPTHRTSSWTKTINRERRSLQKQDKASPSLAAKADILLAEAYPDARFDAADETDLPIDTFPILCPFTLEQIRDPDFLP